MKFKNLQFSTNFNNNLEYSYISNNSGGYISHNYNLFSKIKLNKINLSILEKATFGTPIFKIGNQGNNILIIAGIHGNELPSQLACLNMINYLLNYNLNDTLFLIPFTAPFSTMLNKREFHGKDLNRVSHLESSLTGLILNSISKLNINFVGDFHSSAINSNPGCEAIFSSRTPSLESFLIASFISKSMDSNIINVERAGSIYKGAFEDECNLRNIPAITCEVVSPFGEILKGSSYKSFMQMVYFLKYFGI